LADVTVVTLASWEAGLVVAAGNPKQIRSVEDLARPGVRLINRARGSGSRALLNKLVRRAGIATPAIRGFRRTATGHLAAAYRVACGDADVCLATRPAALGFGLAFVPLARERYDLVIHPTYRDLPAVQRFLDVLQQASVRRRFAELSTYDTSEMGATIA
jgi:putative molybdopterin biosynthesis protein